MKRVFGSSKLGMVFMAMAVLIAAVGCSSSDVVGPTGNTDSSNGNGPLAKEELEGTNDFSFKYSGEIAKFDVDQRVIEFAANDLSSTPLVVVIGKETLLRTAPSRAAFPFDFKYIKVGIGATVYGEQRADGIVDAGLIELVGEIADIDADPDVVLMEGPVVGETFKHFGQISKFDTDLRIIEFVGNDLSTNNLQVEVARDGGYRHGTYGTEVPFDFKYIEVGSFVTVSGVDREGDRPLVNLVVLSNEVDGTDGNPDVVLSQVAAEESPFKYYGQLEKVDEDARVLQFVGDGWSSTSLTVEIARGADYRDGANGTQVPFDFKYIEVGDFVAVSGVEREGDRALVNLVILSNNVDGIDANPDVVLSQVAEEQSPFKHYGQLDKIDEDARVVQFVGDSWSSTSLTVEIARNAELRDRTGVSLPFSFKYIEAGDFVTVFGTLRADGTVLADRVDLPQSVPASDVDPAL